MSQKRPARSAKPRPQKPKRQRKYQGIYAIWNGYEWKWRAAIRIPHEPNPVWGKTCSTQKEAHDDYLALADRVQVLENFGDVPTFGQACEQTCEALMDKGGSIHTEKGYRARFKKWGVGIQPQARMHLVKTEDLRSMLRKRREKHGVNNNGIRCDIRLLRRVFNVAGFTGKKNPAKNLEMPAEEMPDRPFYTMDKLANIVERILAKGQEQGSLKTETEAHADLIIFLAATGIRAFELDRAYARDIDWDDDEQAGAIKVKGKRKGIRRVEFDSGLADVIRRLVIRADGGPISLASTTATILKRWSAILNEPDLCARTLRRSYATELVDHAPLQIVQNQLGHSQLTTTQKYLGTRPQRARAASAALLSRLRPEQISGDPDDDQSQEHADGKPMRKTDRRQQG